ncbi:1-phosphofructokinase family hexose kinase [Wenyingzhuangia sp. IMCC45533]
MKIITLTLNPALDKNGQVEKLIPYEKLETHHVTYHPGGGGINVSRVLQRLGLKNACLFPYGGKTGEHLVSLLEQEQVNIFSSEISAVTRENFAVLETNSAKQYRFGMPTTPYNQNDLKIIETRLNSLVNDGDILVISGSMPPGLPVDYYSKLIEILECREVKIVVDTSGEAFLNILKNKLFMIKPNHHELATLAGKKELKLQEKKDFAMELVESGRVNYVVVSLGAKGAFMAHKNGIEHIEPPKITVKSTVGAGDSMLAGLLYGVYHNYEPSKILKMGVACGTAATQSEGSDLAHKDNINRFFDEL